MTRYASVLAGIVVLASGHKLNAQKMYWTGQEVGGSGFVMRASLDGSGTEKIVSVDYDVRSIALDHANGKVYWINRTSPFSTVWRVNVDGTQAEELFALTTDRPDYLALDMTNDKLFVVSPGGRVYRTNLDGSNLEVIFDMNQNLYGLTIVPAAKVPAVPAVSTWGIATLGLLVLVGGKIYFTYRRAGQA